MHPGRSLPLSISPRGRFPRAVLSHAILLACVSLGLGAVPAPASAQVPSGQGGALARYDIPAGTLDHVLNRFAARAGILLAIDGSLTAGKTSAGLSGNYSLRDGFARILANTGLEAVAQPAGAYALRKVPVAATAPSPVKAQAEAVLPVVKVTAAMERERATGPIEGMVAKRSTTATKTDAPIREVPQSVSIVTRDSLDARAVSSLSEALEYAPGFTGTVSGDENRYDWSIARGIGETYNSNFRDGLKERGSVYAVPKLNVYGAERVEFLRGPASLLFGSNIPGGVVNSITKRPALDARNEIRLQGGDISRRGLAGDFSGALSEEGSVLYRLVVSDERREARTPGTRITEQYIAPAVTLRFSKDTELTLLANHERHRISGDAYPYSFVTPLTYYVPGSEKGWDRFNRNQAAAGYVLDHRVDERLSFHSRGRYSKVSLDYRLTFANTFVSDTVVDRVAQGIRDDSRVWQTDNYVELKWGTRDWAHTTIAGVDYSKVKAALYRGDALTSNYDLTTGRGIGPFIEPVLEASYVDTTRQVGAYAQNQLKIQDRFVVLAGLRKDAYRTDASGLDSQGPVRQDAVTGRVGAVWLLPAGVSPYASYTTSFQPQAGVDHDGRRFKPTSGRQYEVGVRYEPQAFNAQFTAAVFDILQKNVLTANPDSGITELVQRGEVGSRGLELEANASLTRRTDLLASYTWTDARVTRDTDPGVVGNMNANVPRQKIAVWLNHRLVQPGLSIGLGVRHSSKVPDAANLIWVPAVTLVDARVGYGFGRWEVALNARNLLDKDYFATCGGGLCYPGNRRELLGTAAYRW